MVHLDLRPANIFLTCASSYHTMDSLDPQRLVHCSLVNTSSSNSNNSTNIANGGSSGSMGTRLFSHILNAVPLQQYTQHNSNSVYNTATTTTSNHLFSRTNTENSTSSTTNNTYTTTSVLTTITSSMTASEASMYDVRAQVERLLVNRDYVIKLGDLGHCCRIDEKNQFQVKCLFLLLFIA